MVLPSWIAAPGGNPEIGETMAFYGKWHGELWNSEQELYRKDGLTDSDLETARIGSAMASL
jgi:hypothetical protein